MGTVNDRDIFSPNQYEGIYYEAAVVAKRAPTARDKKYEISKVWVDTVLDDVYVLTSITAGVPSWINCGGGTGTFAALNVTGAATIGGVLTLSASTAGTLRTDATGIVSALADGTDGQIPIGSTGLAPAWASITSATLVITPGAGTLNIEESGGTANSYVTTAGGPVAPLVGVLDVLGYDANITTDGGTANTVLIRLADTITSVAGIVATDDLTMTAGTCTITSDDNGAEAIYLHADGGVNEQISIRVDQGTAVNSLNIASDVGGVTVFSGLASADAINIDAADAAGGIDIDFGTGGCSIVGANGAINMESGTAAINVGADAAAHVVTVGSTTTTAQTVIQSGTGDLVMTSTDAVTIDGAGVVEINSSAGIIGIGNDAVAQNINIGTGAAARVVTVGNTSGASQVVIDSGTAGVAMSSTGAGDIIIDSDDTLLLDSDGVLEINSSAGVIGIGNDAVAQNINIGTGAAARVVTIGNATAASQVVLDCGTAGISLGESATVHTTTIGGTTGASALTAQTGTGALTVTAGGIVDVNATDAVTIDSTAGAISVGAGADAFAINVGTGAAARTLTLGNATGVTSVIVNNGTGTASFAANATDHTTNVGSATGVSATTVSAGTGGLSLVAAGIVDVPPAVDSQAGAATTINANVGVSTHTGLTTAAAASQVLTITNSVCTVGSGILCSLSTLGGNDAQCTITRVTPGAGSFTVTYQNLGAAAVNGDLLVTFWILQA